MRSVINFFLILSLNAGLKADWNWKDLCVQDYWLVHSQQLKPKQKVNRRFFTDTRKHGGHQNLVLGMRITS